MRLQVLQWSLVLALTLDSLAASDSGGTACPDEETPSFSQQASALLAYATSSSKQELLDTEQYKRLVGSSSFEGEERAWLWDELWQGIDSDKADVVEEKPHSSSISESSSSFVKRPHTAKPEPKMLPKQLRKMYLLFGPEDSGTNLLQALVDKNWPGKYATQDARKVLWKHSLSGVDDMYSLLKIPYPRLKQLPALIVLRSPISQVASWMSAPYELRKCLDRPVANYSQPCQADLRARSARWLQPDLDLLHFSSVVEIYNSYLRQYRQLLRENRFKSVTVIHYEDMLLTPVKVVRKLARILGERPLAQFHYLGEETAKPQGPQPHGRDAAIEKLKTRSYLQKVGREGLEVLCPLLDQSLLQEMTEGSFLSPEQQVSYLHDCAGYIGKRQTETNE